MKPRSFFLCALIAVSPSFSPAADRETQPQIISRIPRHEVASRVIASVGYSKRLHILEIEFLNGAIYRYFDLPPSVYRDLLSAESKAHYYDVNIKGNYRSLRVRPWTQDRVRR